MKRLTPYYIYYAILALFLTACNGDSHDNDEKPVIDISTAIADAPSTRLGYNGEKCSFTTGDIIHLIALPVGDTSTEKLKTADYTLGDNAKWVPTPILLWDNDDIHLDFFASYGNVTEDTDFMTARTPDWTYAMGDVQLNFNHRTSKLIVHISKIRDELGDNPDINVSIMVKNGMAYNHITDAITLESYNSKRELRDVGDLKYETFILPQTGLRTITVTSGGKDYVWTSDTDLELKASTIVTVNLAVGNDRVLIGSVVVTDWDEVTTIQGEEVEN